MCNMVLISSRFRNLIKPKHCLLFSTYYDSQSGRYMAVPGTQPIRLHDVTMKITDLLPSKPQKFKDSAFIQLKDTILADIEKNLKSITDDSTINRFYFPGQWPLSSILSLGVSRNFEFDCCEHLHDSKSCCLSTVEENISVIKWKESDAAIRVNVLIDVGSLISNGNPTESVMDIVTSVGKLCDADAEVINLVFCRSARNDDDLLDRLDDVVDYVREILEECIGLDVPGAAVIDRLSIQACHSDILDLAKSVGVKRFAVLDPSTNGNIHYTADNGDVYCSIDDPRNYEY